MHLYEIGEYICELLVIQWKGTGSARAVHLLVYFLVSTTTRAGTGPGRVSHTGGRDPAIGAITRCLPGSTFTGIGNRASTQTQACSL